MHKTLLTLCLATICCTAAYSEQEPVKREILSREEKALIRNERLEKAMERWGILMDKLEKNLLSEQEPIEDSNEEIGSEGEREERWKKNVERWEKLQTRFELLLDKWEILINKSEKIFLPEQAPIENNDQEAISEGEAAQNMNDQWEKSRIRYDALMNRWKALMDTLGETTLSEEKKQIEIEIWEKDTERWEENTEDVGKKQDKFEKLMNRWEQLIDKLQYNENA